MEHVVFWSTPAGEETFARVPDRDAAVALVGDLRNGQGVTDANAHALTPLPLAIRTVYVVELGADGSGPADGPVAPLAPLSSSAPPAISAPVPAVEKSPFRAVPAIQAAPVPALEREPEAPVLFEPDPVVVPADITAEIPAARVPALSVVPDAEEPFASFNELSAFLDGEAGQAGETSTAPAHDEPALDAAPAPVEDAAPVEPVMAEPVMAEPSTRSLGLFA